MKLIESIILGIVQGLTEFLPVSSSAHLILVPAWLKWQEPSVLFIVALHFGTFAACLVYFRQDVIRLCVSFFTSLKKMPAFSLFTEMEKLAWMLTASTCVTAILGFLFKKQFERLFENVHGVAFLLLVTAAVLFLAERFKSEKKALADMSFANALLIGLGQTISIAPGISRSGSCISSAVLLGYSKKDAARYAFLLALPAIFGAVLVEGHSHFKELSHHSGLPVLSAGVGASFVSGMFAIDFFMKKIKSLPLSYFSFYCFIAGLSSLLLLK